MIDVTHQISAVRRQVGARLLDAGPDAGEARVVTLTQTYAADVEDVWDACTNADRIGRWFLPISGDLRPGGRYQLEGNAGGTIERCDQPSGFAATWEYGGDVSWIEVRLAAAPGGTRFELEHTAHADDERWAEFGPGAVGIGWDIGFMSLGAHLAGGATMDPAQGQAWMASDEGRRFMAQSSERWFDASVAAGTDQLAARVAANRSTAAYTGG